MILPFFLSAFLALVTLGMAFFCWRRRHLTVAPPLAVFSLCLALAIIFNALFLHFSLATEISDPTLALAQILFWAGWAQIAMAAATCSTLWLVLCWRPLTWPIFWQPLLATGLVLLLLAFAYIRLFRIEWLAGSIDYDPATSLLLFQPTLLARLWVGVFGLIHLVSLSRLLLNWILSSSPSLRQQAKWLLLSLFIPLLQLCSFFLPAQLRATTILYLRPWLLASMPLLIAWTLFRANLKPHYRILVFQRMPAAGIVLDQQQRILALNPAAEQLLQTSAEQVEGRPCSR